MSDDLLIDDYEHLDSTIFYTPINIPGKGCDQNLFHSQILTKCTCKGNCNDPSSCACLQNQGLNYANKKLVDAKLLGEGSVLECNVECTCSSKCENRLVQFGPTTGLKILELTGKGYGIITTNRLLKGEFICEYAGEIISPEEATARRNKDDQHNYIFLLNEFVNEGEIKTIVDATRIGNIARYINHSCAPNCKIVPVRIDSMVPKLAIFAGRDIEANDEITYSYGDASKMSENQINELKPCLCGSSECRKFLPCDL